MAWGQGYVCWYSLPRYPVQSDTVESPPLNLIETVDNDGWHSWDVVRTESSQVKVLKLLLWSWDTGHTGKLGLATALDVT